MNHPAQNDPRTVDELINAALSAGDDDARLDAVAALHWRGSREALTRAEELCNSRCPLERQLGVVVLGQLGVPDRTFPEECLQRLTRMLDEETEPEVLEATLVALSYSCLPRPIARIVDFSSHPHPAVRYGATFALASEKDPLSIETLIRLSTDSEDRVRDWATFGLGTLLDLDTPEIRAALHARLHDPCDDARDEAIVGLAIRHDESVVPVLLQHLQSDLVFNLQVEAAEHLALRILCEPLVALRDWWDVSPTQLEAAIEACRPKDGATPVES